MSGDSYEARHVSGVHFRIKEMLDVAKEISKESLWELDIKKPIYKVVEETRQEEYEVQVPKLDEFGDIIIDEETGEPEYEMETRTRDIQVQVAYIRVTYSLTPKATAEQAILDHYGITDEAKEGDMQLLRQIDVFNTKQPKFHIVVERLCAKHLAAVKQVVGQSVANAGIQRLPLFCVELL